MSDDNVVKLVIPDKKVDSLTENELGMAYGAARALMSAGIPAMPYYAGSGVIYDGKDNVIERKIALCWLTPKGDAVITGTSSGVEFTLERMQILVNGIVEQFKSTLENANEKAPT